MLDLSERKPIADSALSIVLPIYNTKEEIPQIVNQWVSYLKTLKKDYEILLVDDSNSEEISNVLAELAQKNTHLQILRHETQKGFGAALKTGIQAARFPLLCYSPCDRQYDAKDLGKLLENIDKVDLVSGLREETPPTWYRVCHLVYRLLCLVFIGIPLDPPRCWFGWSGFRRRWLARWIFGVRLEDVECPFRLFRRELFQNLPIQSTGTFAHIEILAKANFLNGFMMDVPVKHHPLDNPDPKLPSLSKPTWKEIRKVLARPKFGPTPPREKEDAPKPEQMLLPTHKLNSTESQSDSLSTSGGSDE